MRGLAIVLLFLVFDGTFAAVNQGVVEHSNSRVQPQLEEETTSFLELSTQFLPFRQYIPLIFVSFPTILICLIFLAARQSHSASTMAHHIVKRLRSIVSEIVKKQKSVSLVSPTYFSELLMFITVFAIGGMLIVLASFLTFGMPVPGWKPANGLSRFMIAFWHIGVVSTSAGGIFLFLLPYVYDHLLRLRRYRVITPDASITADAAFRIVLDYRAAREMLTDGYQLPSQIRLKSIAAKREGKKVVPTTFESWKDADDSNEQSVDPIRVLLSYFHPTVMMSRTNIDPLKHYYQKVLDSTTSKGAKVLSLDEMLQLVYDFRAATAQQQDTKELRAKLEPQLKAVWKCMLKERKFRSKDKLDPLRAVLHEGMYMGAFPISALWFLEELFDWTGVGGDCEDLASEDGGVKQGLTWLYLKEEMTYPTIPNALNWDCPVGCHLQCELGYRGTNDHVECSDLGGAGMIWSHLLSETPDVAACCIDTADAAVLSGFYVNSTALTFSNDQTFSIGCGAEQTIAVQICKKSTGSSDWEKEQDCSVSCRLDPISLEVENKDNCDHVIVSAAFPSDSWASLANETIAISSDSMSLFTKSFASGEAIGVSISSLVKDVPVRLAYSRPSGSGTHLVYGNWQKWTETPPESKH